MDLRQRRYKERPLVKTKIIATAGPACETSAQLRELILAGADLFRLNFAHGSHEWLERVVASIRQVSLELGRPIGILADLAGPKIRLGELPPEGIVCALGDRFEFVRGEPAGLRQLTSTYQPLVADLAEGDRVLLADGTVAMRVLEKHEAEGRVICEVEQPGTIRSRQGINLPGVALSTPSLTEKDRGDLTWALAREIDFIGLSFVRSAEDIDLLRSAIADHEPRFAPQIVAKIEKIEAVNDLDRILERADAAMVARGDLGVEVDIARVPTLQKRIVRLCNQHRIPVITATQMLDSMQRNELPTRAEASDVANAVIDGSDAVMLSGETAVGAHPVAAVAMMSRIAHEAERLVAPAQYGDVSSQPRTRATLITEAVTLGAGTAAQHLDADLIVVATHSGRTAMAVSKQRHSVPILALTDQPETARRMSLYWGVTALETNAVQSPPTKLLELVVEWGLREQVLASGSKLVLVGSTNWSAVGHDMLLVHAVP